MMDLESEGVMEDGQWGKTWNLEPAAARFLWGPPTLVGVPPTKEGVAQLENSMYVGAALNVATNIGLR